MKWFTFFRTTILWYKVYNFRCCQISCHITSTVVTIYKAIRFSGDWSCTTWTLRPIKCGGLVHIFSILVSYIFLCVSVILLPPPLFLYLTYLYSLYCYEFEISFCLFLPSRYWSSSESVLYWYPFCFYFFLQQTLRHAQNYNIPGKRDRPLNKWRRTQ